MKNKSLPYAMIPKYTEFNGAVQLYAHDDGRFQITKDGKFCSLIWAPPSYFLIRSRLARLLLERKVRDILIKSAYIFRKSTGESWNNYFEIRISNSIMSNPSINVEGYRMWYSDFAHVLVSPKLKDFIQENGFDDLEFYHGYDMVRKHWL